MSTINVTELIGKVGFELDTKSLEKYEKTLQKMHSQMDSFIKKMSTVENGLNRLSKHFDSAGNKIDRFNDKLKQTSERTQGVTKSVKDMGVTIGGVRNHISNTASQLSAYSAAARQAAASAKALADANGSIKGTRISAGGAGGGGRRRGGSFVGAMAGATMPWARSFLPGLGVGWATMMGVEKAETMAGMPMQLEMITGSAEAARKKMEELRQVAKNTNSPLSEVAQDYISMATAVEGTSLEQGLSKNYESFIKYTKLSGLSSESMKGTLKALRQMVGKDQIYAEELRGQMGEHMPAAIKLMADAIAGGDTSKLNKMLEKGIKGKDMEKALQSFFDKLDERVKRSSGLWDKYLGSLKGKHDTFRSAWENFFGIFAQSGFSAGMGKIFDRLAKFLNENPQLAVALGKAFEMFANVLVRVIDGVQWLIDLWKGLPEGVKDTIIFFLKLAASLFVVTRVFRLLGTLIKWVAGLWKGFKEGSIFGSVFKTITALLGIGAAGKMTSEPGKDVAPTAPAPYVPDFQGAGYGVLQTPSNTTNNSSSVVMNNTFNSYTKPEDIAAELDSLMKQQQSVYPRVE